MHIRAVIDRFEENQAVLLVGEDERQVIWCRQDLPSAATEGDILRIDIGIDREATHQAKAEATEILRRLTSDSSRG
jgi:hypothetical protein